MEKLTVAELESKITTLLDENAPETLSDYANYLADLGIMMNRINKKYSEKYEEQINILRDW
jgi:hypothetical protein